MFCSVNAVSYSFFLDVYLINETHLMSELVDVGYLSKPLVPVTTILIFKK